MAQVDVGVSAVVELDSLLIALIRAHSTFAPVASSEPAGAPASILSLTASTLNSEYGAILKHSAVIAEALTTEGTVKVAVMVPPEGIVAISWQYQTLHSVPSPGALSISTLSARCQVLSPVESATPLTPDSGSSAIRTTTSCPAVAVLFRLIASEVSEAAVLAFVP